MSSQVTRQQLVAGASHTAAASHRAMSSQVTRQQLVAGASHTADHRAMTSLPRRQQLVAGASHIAAASLTVHRPSETSRLRKAEMAGAPHLLLIEFTELPLIVIHWRGIVCICAGWHKSQFLTIDNILRHLILC